MYIYTYIYIYIYILYISELNTNIYYTKPRTQVNYKNV